MGKIAEALRTNLRTIAQSDARTLRELDQQLIKARETVAPAALSTAPDVKALLGKGSFQQHNVPTLRRLCKENSIKGFWKLKKAELCKTLEEQGIEPPPRPLESFSKKELVALVRQLLGPAL